MTGRPLDVAGERIYIRDLRNPKSATVSADSSTSEEHHERRSLRVEREGHDPNAAPPDGPTGPEEEGEDAASKGGYGEYNNGGGLEFDPLKDLNLPASYDEVVARFNRLQGERAVEVLN